MNPRRFSIHFLLICLQYSSISIFLYIILASLPMLLLFSDIYIKVKVRRWIARPTCSIATEVNKGMAEEEVADTKEFCLNLPLILQLRTSNMWSPTSRCMNRSIKYNVHHFILCYDHALIHSNCAWLSLWLGSERYAMCCSGEPELQACYVYQESMPKYTRYGCRNTHGLPVTKMHENARICWNISQDMLKHVFR